MTKSLKDRFDEKWIAEPNTGCWLWTASITSSGYGLIKHSGKLLTAHRLAYEWYITTIPDGKELDHLCRTPACVNPWHLEPVTHRENVLRGISPAALCAKKTHCPAGHKYEGENLYVCKKGSRKCKACGRERKQRSYYRQLGRANT